MKLRFILFLFFVGWAIQGPFSLVAEIQNNETDPLFYWVSFTDKADSPYTLSQPGVFLSQRSLLRRENQGITLTESDLPVNPHYVDSLLNDKAVQVVYVSRWFNGALVKTHLETSMNRVRQFPFVSATLNVKPEAGKIRAPGAGDIKFGVHAGGLQMPSEASEEVARQDKMPGARLMLPLDGPDYGESRQQIEQLNGHFLHTQGFLGRGKHIAVFDSGFLNVDQLWVFASLWADGRVIGVRDFVEPGGNVFSSHNHGMAVLSVMAADSPGSLIGTAPEASYWLLRTEDVGSEYRIEEYNWLAAAEFADSAGVDIINSSLGYTHFDDPDQNYTYADMDGKTSVVARAASLAFERGMLVINSAGNYGAQDWQYIGSPADSPGALAIGAIDENGIRTSWSSIGPTADGRIKPGVMARGLRVSTVNPYNGVSAVNGTSFSAPLISGLAACLWEKYPWLGAADVVGLIIRSASQYREPDNFMGYGIADFEKAASIPGMGMKQQSLSLFPNPISPESSLDFFSDASYAMDVDLINMKGEVVYSMNHIPVDVGFNQIRAFAGISHLPQGIYLVRLTGNNFTRSIKALKVK